MLVQFKIDNQVRVAKIECTVKKAKKIINEYHDEYNKGIYIDSLNNSWLTKKGYDNIMFFPSIVEL